MPRRLLVASLFLIFSGYTTVLAGSLHEAARKGDVEGLKQILDQGADLEQRDETGETLLISAARAPISVLEMIGG